MGLEKEREKRSTKVQVAQKCWKGILSLKQEQGFTKSAEANFKKRERSMKQVVAHGNSLPNETKPCLRGFQRQLSKHMDKSRTLSIIIQTTHTILRKVPKVTHLEKTIRRNHHV